MTDLSPSPPGQTSLRRSAPRFPLSAFRFPLLLALLPICYLWFRLIDNVRIEWSTNDQYSYGWVVPILCFGLLIRRFSDPDFKSQVSAFGPQSTFHSPRSFFALSAWPFALTSFLLAFLYLPTRLVECAVPEWRPIQWMLALITVGLTLSMVYAWKGKHWLRHLAFPICFILVAIPWPTQIESPVIQNLTQFNASFVIEIMAVLGIPAVQHGNLIEVGTGLVGIDEACSGIRSFQSSLMISLFLGEFFRMRLGKRLMLVPIGFILAILFNVCRTSFLTYAAAKKGPQAIAEYHDPAGLAILIACTLSMWLLALLLNRHKSTVHSPRSFGPDSQVSGLSSQPSTSSSPQSGYQLSTINYQLSTILIAWLLLVEAGVQLWYHSREVKLPPAPQWSVAFPVDNPTYKELPMSDKTKHLLRFDQGQQGNWKETDGTDYSAFYFNWQPGRVAGYLAKRHTPDACFPASGFSLVAGPALQVLTIKGIELPMRSYIFEKNNVQYHVFQARWEAGASSSAYVEHEESRMQLLRGIWSGRGNKGQKVVEVIINGIQDPEDAKKAMVAELQKLIKVENLGQR